MRCRGSDAVHAAALAAVVTFNVAGCGLVIGDYEVGDASTDGAIGADDAAIGGDDTSVADGASGDEASHRDGATDAKSGGDADNVTVCGNGAGTRPITLIYDADAGTCPSCYAHSGGQLCRLLCNASVDCGGTSMCKAFSNDAGTLMLCE